jgi:TatD DNase family protein
MLGLHPWHVDKATHGWDRRLLDLLQTSSIGVGECGLDFTVSEANQDTQVAALETQWRIALELNRPLSLHCRKAFDSLFEMAKKLGLPQAGAVIHAFSGSAEQAACAIRQGFYLSFACSLMNPKNQRARKALKVVPIECLLLETDSPDISPTPGVNNEPANLVQLFCITAELLGEATETLEKQLQDNVDKVFFRG